MLFSVFGGGKSYSDASLAINVLSIHIMTGKMWVSVQFSRISPFDKR